LHGESHFAAGLRLAGHFAKLEIAEQFVRPHRADPGIRIGRDIGRMPGAEHGTGELVAAVLLHEEAARCMAFAAVRRAVNEILATVPFGGLRWIGCEGLRLEEQRVPERH